MDASVDREVAAAPDAVWAIVRDFGDVSWIPPAGRVEVEGEGPGMIRFIHGGGDGDPVAERLLSRSDDDRTIVYTIEGNNPLPVTSYEGTVSVDAAGTGTRINWRARYEPAGDAAEATAIVELMLGTLIGWLADAVTTG